ncbi:hypothetical protein D3C73_1481960 [compost metagenome]
MTDGNAEPSNEARHAGGVQKPEIDHPVPKEGSEERKQAEGRRDQEGVDRDASLVKLGQELGRLLLFGQHPEHARGGVHARVAGG